MSTVLSGVAVVVMILWLIATALANTPVGDRILTSVIGTRRIRALVPTWSFFAPRPVSYDVTLLYRERLADGECSPWREAIPFPRRHPIIRAFWNPGARAFKAVSDASNVLILSARAAPQPVSPRSLMLSIPYLLLLAKTSSLKIGVGVVSRQFALVRHSHRDARIAVTFVSGFHDVSTSVTDGERMSRCPSRLPSS